MGKGERILTPVFAMVTGINFSSALVFYLLLVKTADYALAVHGVSHGLAGAAVGSFVIATIVSRFLFGRKIDEWGFKRSIVVGHLIMAPATLAYLANGGFAFFLLARVVHGFGMGISSSALGAAAGLIVPAGRRGEGIGYFTMSLAFATAVGPFAAILLSGSPAGYSSLFVFTAIVTFAGLLCSMFLEIPRLPAPDLARGPSVRPPFSLNELVQVSVLPVCLVAFLVYVCYSGVTAYLTGFCASRDLTVASSLYFVVYAIAIIVARPPVGRLIDRRGENSIMYATPIALAVGLVILAFSHGAAPLLVSAALVGFGIGITQSTLQTVVINLVAPQDLGRASSTYYTALDLGPGIAPAIMGALLPGVGYQAMYCALAAVALLAGFLYHFGHGRKGERITA